MGNKLLTQFKVDKSPSVRSNELRWTLYPATHTERGNDPLTVFLFEKKTLDRAPKDHKDGVLEILRKDASALQRLRHPNILHMMEALVEDRSSVAFATKRIDTNLSQLLELDRMSISNVEMKCGLLDIAEAIRFLHQDAKTAHLGIAPTNIFISPNGKWLLGGFGYSIGNTEAGALQPCVFNYQLELTSQISTDPSLKYCAPEMTGGMSGQCGLESDIFSLGLIAFECMSTERRSFLQAVSRNDKNQHQEKLKQLLPFTKVNVYFCKFTISHLEVPKELANVLGSMLTPDPRHRCNIAAFLQSEFFQDINIKALRFLDTLDEKDIAQKTQFLKGFTTLLQQPGSEMSSNRIVKDRIIPRLVAALNLPALYGQVLTNILICLRKTEMKPNEFQTSVWPGMKALFTAKEIPIEAVVDLLKNLQMLIGLLNSSEINVVILPFVNRCLEITEPTILDEILSRIPEIYSSFDYKEMKDQLLPRMLATLLKPDCSLKIRVKILLGVNTMFQKQIFDRVTVLDTIVTAMERIQKMDRSPALCMTLLSNYDAISKFLGPKETAQRIMPLISQMLVEESLTEQQWRTQMDVFKKLLQRVEASREKEYAARGDSAADVSAALGGGPTGLADLGGLGGMAQPKIPQKADDSADFLASLGAMGTTTQSVSQKPNIGESTLPPSADNSRGSDSIDLFGPVVSNLGPPPRSVTGNTSTAGSSSLLDDFGMSQNTTSQKMSSIGGGAFPSSFPAPSSSTTGGGAGTDLLEMGLNSTPAPLSNTHSNTTASKPNPSDIFAQLNNNSSLYGGTAPGTRASTVSSSFANMNWDPSKTGVSGKGCGVANMNGDPFADLAGPGGNNNNIFGSGLGGMSNTGTNMGNGNAASGSGGMMGNQGAFGSSIGNGHGTMPGTLNFGSNMPNSNDPFAGLS